MQFQSSDVPGDAPAPAPLQSNSSQQVPLQMRMLAKSTQLPAILTGPLTSANVPNSVLELPQSHPAGPMPPMYAHDAIPSSFQSATPGSGFELALPPLSTLHSSSTATVTANSLSATTAMYATFPALPNQNNLPGKQGPPKTKRRRGNAGAGPMSLEQQLLMQQQMEQQMQRKREREMNRKVNKRKPRTRNSSVTIDHKNPSSIANSIAPKDTETYTLQAESRLQPSVGPSNLLSTEKLVHDSQGMNMFAANPTPNTSRPSIQNPSVLDFGVYPGILQQQNRASSEVISAMRANSSARSPYRSDAFRNDQSAFPVSASQGTISAPVYSAAPFPQRVLYSAITPFSTEMKPELRSAQETNSSSVLLQPVLVNYKQYHRILKRREARLRHITALKGLLQKKPYLHESRHKHAMKRPRGADGRFLTKDELDALNNAS